MKFTRRTWLSSLGSLIAGLFASRKALANGGIVPPGTPINLTAGSIWPRSQVNLMKQALHDHDDVKMGIRSIDEVRRYRELEPIDQPRFAFPFDQTPFRFTPPSKSIQDAAPCSQKS